MGQRKRTCVSEQLVKVLAVAADTLGYSAAERNDFNQVVTLFCSFGFLQETPDEIPEGETPATATIFAFDDLVDAVRPGDRCSRIPVGRL